MNWIQIVSGPLIGGVIGYFTNYIAVKMLFRPRRAIQIGGRTLPFTPGVIPKRRADLARAVSHAIERNLFQRDDLVQMLASEEMQASVADGILNKVAAQLEGKTLDEVAVQMAGQERVDHWIELGKDAISARVTAKLTDMNLGAIITRLATDAVLSKLQGTMFAMFINGDLIASLTDPMANKINAYVLSDGVQQINGLIAEEIEKLCSRPAEEVLHFDEAMRVRLSEKLRSIYAAFITENAPKLVENFDIAGTVEAKINAMDVVELEQLVLSVMKKELNTIVNLGAVLGLLIGILNIFL